MTERLKYLATAVCDQLRVDVRANLARYRSGDFADLMRSGEWAIELPQEVDLEPLASLDPSRTSVAEVANSRTVWSVLKALTPALAYEEGIWTRLTHVECLGFARARWLGQELDDDQLEQMVLKHFFANTLTKRRDDNAISRLWWNAHIAELIMPGTDLAPLGSLLRKADIRLNLVERSLTASRVPLTVAILKLLDGEQWLTDKEENFRAFMRVLNKRGGGIVFEAMDEADVLAFVRDCALRAGMPRDLGQAA